MFVDGSRSGRGTDDVVTDAAKVSVASDRGPVSRHAGIASSATAPSITLQQRTRSYLLEKQAAMTLEHVTAPERRVPTHAPSRKFREKNLMVSSGCAQLLDHGC